MLDSRQTELLKLIIEDYAKTAKPVSSKALCDFFNCSSATIRNEMMNLEDIGLLEKTHISSGRVPSEKGYRYYVDNIMKPEQLSKNDISKLQDILNNNHLQVADYITKSVEIVSELTNLTAIVLGNSSINTKVVKVEVVPVNEKSLIAILVTDTGHVEHRNIVIEEEVSLTDIKQTVDIISKMIVGTKLDEVSTVLEYNVKPVIEQCVRQHEVLYNAFYTAFSDFAKDASVIGRKNILMQPEFDNTSKIREIISKFEDKNIIDKIEEKDNGINIYIGTETDFDEDVTIIKMKYDVKGEEGTIALIGPKRMDYKKAITLLEYLENNINKED
jgi:heat-inducible transcriptional repressor